MRPLPDPDLSLRDASDFIFESELCRVALKAPEPESLAVFLRDLIATIYRLTTSCHLAEFTDHGLNHLCSLVDRLSRWTTQHDTAASRLVVKELGPSECAVLLLATLMHDIGMLSQRQEDMPGQQPQWESRGVEDLANWVRATHIPRMKHLVTRLFEDSEHSGLIAHAVSQRAFRVAEAHGSWPSEWGSIGFVNRDSGLAAMLAVADLLDEDSNRCDTETLLHHRSGTYLNCAHWIRHGLTGGRVLIQGGAIDVVLRRPPDTDAQLESVYRALRNHYRICYLYLQELAQVGAGIVRIAFTPPDGCPQAIAPELTGWKHLRGFGTQAAFVYHLLNSFMPQALLDSSRLAPTEIQRLRALGLQEIDLTEFQRIRGGIELHALEEQAFHALAGHVT